MVRSWLDSVIFKVFSNLSDSMKGKSKSGECRSSLIIPVSLVFSKGLIVARSWTKLVSRGTV